MKKAALYLFSSFLCFIIVLVITAHFTTMAQPVPPQPMPSQPAPHRLHIMGNHFADANGNMVVLRGASHWSLEFGCGAGAFTLRDFQAMRSWGMNIVRLPLNENYLLFPGLCGGTKYLDTVKSTVSNAEATGMYVLLDLHWINPYSNASRGGQYPMPDSKAKQFWQTLTTLYKNDDKVLYEMMNEPHDVSCAIWKNGGSVTSSKENWSGEIQDGTYQATGFQQLADLIHSIAPTALIIQGTSGEADATCAETNPLTGNNIAYQAHFYVTDPTKWAASFQNLTSKVPVIAGEFDTRQGIKVVNVFEGLKTGYLGWVWEGCAGMTADCNGTPADGWKAIHDAMLVASQKQQ
jgi:endoglucanase